MSRNALTRNSVLDVAMNWDAFSQVDHTYSHRITNEMKKVTNQKSSGRCWGFAGLNLMRLAVCEKYNITVNTKNYIIAPSASGPTKRWDVNNYIKLLEELDRKHPSKFFISCGASDEILIKDIMDSSVGKNCIALSQKNIEEIIPIIGACNYGICNDTGFAHIASGLGLKCLVLFMDSPPAAYGTYSKNISIIVPDGESIESCGHNTRGKDKISFNDVLKKSLELIN